MGHKDHKEFTSSVLRQLCEDAGKSLPPFDSSATWETKAEIVLDHLKSKVVDFCGVKEGLGLENVEGFPRYAQLVYEISDIVDFDLVNEHAGFIFFRKAPIIMRYVVDAIGRRNPSH